MTGVEAWGDDRCLVKVRVVGDFPGGQADLTYSFTLEGDEISARSIVE